MKRFSRRTWILIGVLAVVALAGAVGSYAYFTTTGAGTGTITVASAQTLTLSSEPVSGLYPGADPTVVSVKIEHEGLPVYVGTITGFVDPASTPPGCDASWFVVTPYTLGVIIQGGLNPSVPLSVQLKETGTNQDACQHASVTIEWRESPSAPAPAP